MRAGRRRTLRRWRVYKTATGVYEADFRRESIAPRLHLSYGTKKKAEAERLDGVMQRLYKGRHVGVIERIRSGALSVHCVADHLDADLPIAALTAVPVVAATEAAWPSVRDAVTEYLDWLRTNPRKSKGTHRTAKSMCDRFLGWLGDDAALPLDQIPTARVTAYQASMIDGGSATNTVTGNVWRVGALFRWHREREQRAAQEAKREARWLHVPLDPDSTSTARTQRKRYLTEAEAERLLTACPARLLCPVAIGLFAGLRIDEVMHLRPAFDVDLKLGLLTIQEQPDWSPKSRKARHVPIAAPLRPVLERHLASYASEDWLVPSPANPTRPYNPNGFMVHFKQIVTSAELVAGRKDPRGVVYHTLRHSFASWLVMRGVDLYTVSQLLGNSLKVTEVTYAHLSPDFKTAAIAKLTGVFTVPEMEVES
jgi:integrase